MKAENVQGPGGFKPTTISFTMETQADMASALISLGLLSKTMVEEEFEKQCKKYGHDFFPCVRKEDVKTMMHVYRILRDEAKEMGLMPCKEKPRRNP